MRRLLYTVLILIACLSLEAQIGITTIGVISIGADNIPKLSIGKATTPKCDIPGPCNSPCAVYTFIGSGEWSIEENWEGAQMPPPVLNGCMQIVINPSGSQECLLNIPLQIIPAGATITVMPGKKFRVPSRLLLQ